MMPVVRLNYVENSYDASGEIIMKEKINQKNKWTGLRLFSWINFVLSPGTVRHPFPSFLVICRVITTSGIHPIPGGVGVGEGGGVFCPRIYNIVFFSFFCLRLWIQTF